MRNIVQEIAAKRQRIDSLPRGDHSRRIDLAFKRIERLEAAEEALAGSDGPDEGARSELRRYFPIATVACIESYFRLSIQDLVDAGSPYSERGCKLLDGRLQTEYLAHLQGRRLTVGELVAHSAKLSTLPDIDRALSTLLNVDFLSYLETVDLEDEPFNIRAEFSAELLRWGNDFYSALSSVFQARHIYCHEFAVTEALDPSRMLFVGVMLPSFFAVCDIVITVAIAVPDILAKQVRNPRTRDDFAKPASEVGITHPEGARSSSASCPCDATKTPPKAPPADHPSSNTGRSRRKTKANIRPSSANPKMR